MFFNFVFYFGLFTNLYLQRRCFFKPTAKVQFFFKLYKDFTKKVIFFAFSVRFHNHQIVFHSEITLKTLGRKQVGCGWFNGNNQVLFQFRGQRYKKNEAYRSFCRLKSFACPVYIISLQYSNILKMLHMNKKKCPNCQSAKTKKNDLYAKFCKINTPRVGQT